MRRSFAWRRSETPSLSNGSIRSEFRFFVPVVMLLTAAASLAHGAERGEAKLTLAGKKVVIEYGRPALAGRDMLARLAPGQAWRMGADADTTLKTAADLAFGASVVPKGDYVLSAMRSADNKWTLIANSGERAVQVPLTEQKLASSVEVFTIELSGQGHKGQFLMGWGSMALSAPFTAK